MRARLLWAWVLSRRGALSAHAYMHKIENGADAGLWAHMINPPQSALHVIGISQQWRAYLTDGNSVTPAQVNSIKIKEESVNLRWREIGSFRSPCALLGQQIRFGYRVFSGLFRMRDGRCWHFADSVNRRAECVLFGGGSGQRPFAPLTLSGRSPGSLFVLLHQVANAVPVPALYW